tara:strand:- start:737 stop:1174 length:438 start_codon:yes stop_codon:yes gene_type:complete
MDQIQKVALGSETSFFTANLFHANEAVRFWAATGIGNYVKRGNQELISKLRLLLTDDDTTVRIATARALCILNMEKEGVKALSEGLKDKDEWNRLNAALVLDEIGEKARPAINDLQSVMKDQNKYVVRVVNHALNMLLNTTNEVR